MRSPRNAEYIRKTAPCICAALLFVTAAGCHSPAKRFDPLPPTADGLAGTQWQLDDIVVSFKQPPDLEVSGGGVPEGATLSGTYTVRDGIIEITVLNRSRAGTWDGRKMVVDGVDGVRIS